MSQGQDRYVVIVVSRITGEPTLWGARTSRSVFYGEQGAEDAHEVARQWNAKHPWAAFVVGLRPDEAQGAER